MSNTTFIFFQAKFFTLLILIFSSYFSFAGGIRGNIKNDKGEPMPFASVLVKGTEIATMANTEGKFEVKLNAGKYDIIFQFVGYQAVMKSVDIIDKFEELEIVMKETVIQLGEAKVKSNNEDPALTIMRKTIAMSPYHHKEIESYSLRDYVRGSFRVDDVPFIFEKAMKKNFITKGQTYVLESVNEIKFKQPNSFTKKAISIRSNFPPPMKGQENISAGRINYYNPNDATSPVTVKGAAFYKYIYLGFFEDKGLTINKIKVIPKVKSPGYVSGVMNIIDGSWYIHSVDFNSIEETGDTRTKVIFSPIQDIWLPVQANISSKIDVFGVDGNVSFVVSYKNYQIVKNPKYATIKPQVLDDKIFKTEAKELNAQKIDKKTFSNQKELTTKQLAKAIKEFEKDEIALKKEKNEEIINREYTSSEDSLARKRTEDFWETERQVPLTEIESKGYKKADSLYKTKEKEITIKLKKDSTEKARPDKFEPSHLLVGHNYSYVPFDKNAKNKIYKHQFRLGSWFENTRYNAVEGINIGIPSLGYSRKLDSIRGFGFTIRPQYSIHRERINGSFTGGYSRKNFGFNIETGRQVYQINTEKPITNLLNAGFALFDNQHYAKFFEQKYFHLNLFPTIDKNFTISTSLQFNERYRLQNIVNQGFFRRPDDFYEQNRPISRSYSDFMHNLQSRWVTNITFRPFSRTTIYNGVKNIQRYGPYFRLKNTNAFGEASFNQVELSANYNFRLGLSNVSLRVEAGTFYGKKPSVFLDFKHFNGNQLFIQPHEEFRDLPYYSLSTNGSYSQIFGKIEFKRLFLTQIPYLQKNAWKENLFINFLSVPYEHHLELGYGINGLLGTIKADLYTVFDINGYSHAGFRAYLPLRFFNSIMQQ